MQKKYSGLLGDFVPQILYRGFAPGPHWGLTSPRPPLGPILVFPGSALGTSYSTCACVCQVQESTADKSRRVDSVAKACDSGCHVIMGRSDQLMKLNDEHSDDETSEKHVSSATQQHQVLSSVSLTSYCSVQRPQYSGTVQYSMSRSYSL